MALIAVALVGLVCVAVGAALVFPPAGLMVFGAGLVYAAWSAAKEKP